MTDRLFTSPTPAFSRRGFMLDVSRCRVPAMASLRRLVELLASLRFNELQLYTEHTFAYRGHEAVWREASPLTPEEVRTLDGWCAARKIELVPNQNSLGHFERWLKHPAYAPLAESANGFTTPWGEFRRQASTLRPGPEAEALLAGLYGQLLPCFRSGRFNVGCDEPFELGQGASREACASRGRASVFLDHLAAVHRLAAGQGRTIQFWADVLFEENADLARVPADATALVWGYEAEHPFKRQCATVAATGRRFYVCPGDSSWNSLGGRLHTARANLANAAAAGAWYGAEGLLLTHWGDNGHWQPWAAMLPGLILGATTAWDGTPCAWDELAGALDFLAGDATDTFGRALIELGRLDELHDANPHNRSLLWEALFKTRDYLGLGGRLTAVDGAVWPEIALRAARVRERLAASAPSADDGPLLVREAMAAAKRIEAAARRAASLAGAPASFPGGAEEAMIPELVREHRELWLQRSRPGGLEESAGLLESGTRSEEQKGRG